MLAQTTGAVTSQSIAPDAGETYGENVGSNGGVFTTSASRHVAVSGYVDTSAGRITTTVDQTFGFANKQELNLTNFLENVTHDETIDTVTTTAGPGGTDRPPRRRVVPAAHALAVPGAGAGAEGLLPAARRRRAVARAHDDA